ncbi:MAG TPA: hypothetical protein VF723_08090 [Pyrinomonadaceae bacterium]
MKKFLLSCALGALVVGTTGAQTPAQTETQTPAPGQAAAGAQQGRVVGEVTAIDAASGQVTLKTEAGLLVTVTTGERTSFLRFAPGETRPENAAKIKLSDISVGDRLFARGQVSADGKAVTARQLVVTNQAALAAQQESARDEWRRRGINGRVTALNPQTKEITIQTRTREGVGTVVIAASDNVRLLRYAPDSASLTDARPGTFADIKVGDQLRARGERSADGTRFTPEEIVSGAFVRAGGTVTAVNAAANELTLRNEQTGKSVTVAIGRKSSLRRITPEVIASMGERSERREQRNNDQAASGATGGAASGATGTRPPSGGEPGNAGRGGRGNRGAGGPRPGGGGGGAGGRGFQEMLEGLPAITVADLKKGDVVMITGTAANADQSRVTAIMLVTGDAEFLNRLLRFQGRPGRDGQNMNPGLPGGVVGGGSTNPQQPQR